MSDSARIVRMEALHRQVRANGDLHPPYEIRRREQDALALLGGGADDQRSR